jgi:hypothetical protein
MPNNRKRICVNRQLHPEIFSLSLASLGNIHWHRELLHRGSVVAKRASRFAGFAPTTLTAMFVEEIAASRPRNMHLGLGSEIK